MADRFIRAQGFKPCRLGSGFSFGGTRCEPCARDVKQVVADPPVGTAQAATARARPPAPTATPRARPDVSASADSAGSVLPPPPQDPHRWLAHAPDAPCHQQWRSSTSRCVSRPVRSGSRGCHRPANASRSCRGSGWGPRRGCARCGPGAARRLGAGADGDGSCVRPRAEDTVLLAHMSTNIMCQKSMPSALRESPKRGLPLRHPHVSGLAAQSGSCGTPGTRRPGVQGSVESKSGPPSPHATGGDWSWGTHTRTTPVQVPPWPSMPRKVTW